MIIFEPRFDLPSKNKVKGDLAFDLILNNQVEKLKFCFENFIFAPSQLICNEETILGRIIQEVRVDCLKVCGFESRYFN